MNKHLLTLSAALLLTFTAVAQGPRTPVFDPSYPQIHDPVLINCDGTWYMYATSLGIEFLTSKDLVTWERGGRVFENPPQWVEKYVPGFRGHIWAPDINYHNGIYYLFYSCSSFGKNTSAIGVATNKTLNPASPDYKWEDHGCVVNSVAGRDLWNAIDPNLAFDENGDGWLTFGSFWGGIKLVKLDPTCTKVAEPEVWFPICRRPEGTAEDTSKTDTAIKADPRGHDFDPGNGAVEAPFIIKHGDYYYLFASYDLCCRGANSTYNVVVGRSAVITGPYLDADGTPLMEGGGTLVAGGNERYPGVGHCGIAIKDGEEVMVMHGYDKEYNYGSKLLVRPIIWDAEGWPSVVL